ncbi:MAG: sodium-dependent transporter [Azoarcus sp.]|jgi:NSS family neurotransmitter:Na+ symporter|nr:sodium-dependent transporter [Azoarcus sp.]
MNQPVSRSTWTNRWAFILVTIGSAVGLGNIWKFSYLVGAKGGSAFVLVYLCCVALIGLPLLMAEILIGRRGRGNPVAAMLNTAEETGNSSWWALLGWVGMLGALVILSYYSVVAGWIADYLYQAAIGVRVETAAAAAQAFADLERDPLRMGFWHTVFLALSVGVTARGVVAGIEVANKIMMPSLFLILVLLTVWGAVAGDMPAALHFMYDFKIKALTPGVVLSAMGQAFFSLSLGMGAIMTYGSYLDKEARIGYVSLWVAVAGSLVGLLSGMAIFSLTFGYGLDPSVGPELILQALPLAFAHMPGGQLVAVLFFVFVLFAAWTSAISLLEPFVSWLTERYGIHRAKAAWGTGVPVWLLGLAVCMSFSRWSDFTMFGRNLFDALDQCATNVMMPLSGLAIAIYVGWMMGRAPVRDEMKLGVRAFPLWFNVLRYVVPVGIVLVFFHVLGLLDWLK